MSRVRRHQLLGVLVLSCLALCLPLVLLPGTTPYTFDETNFYVPTIRQIRAAWPHLDLNGSNLSATAPGYQYVLASLSFLTGPSLLALRLLNLGLSLGLPVLLWFAWPPDTGQPLRLCALVPLVGGCFFVRSASNVMTDNAALLAATAALALILVPRLQPGIGGAGVGAALAVFFRQNTIWLEAPLLVCWPGLGRPGPWWTLLCAPLVLGVLILAWGGLVPPGWRAQTGGGLGYAAAPYQLAVLGVLGWFYYASVTTRWRDDLRNRWNWAGAAAGLILALACPSDPSYDAGRWGGYLWSAAEHLPSLGRHSVLFMILAPWGGWMLTALSRRLWSAAGTRITVVWLSALLAFFASSLLNRQVHQRYYEPVLLVLLIFWHILLASVQPPGAPVRLRPLMVLGTGQVLVTLLTAYGRTFGVL